MCYAMSGRLLHPGRDLEGLAREREGEEEREEGLAIPYIANHSD
jgi:hypothetical protein